MCLRKLRFLHKLRRIAPVPFDNGGKQQTRQHARVKHELLCSRTRIHGLEKSLEKIFNFFGRRAKQPVRLLRSADSMELCFRFLVEDSILLQSMPKPGVMLRIDAVKGAMMRSDGICKQRCRERCIWTEGLRIIVARKQKANRSKGVIDRAARDILSAHGLCKIILKGGSRLTYIMYKPCKVCQRRQTAARKRGRRINRGFSIVLFHGLQTLPAVFDVRIIIQERSPFDTELQMHVIYFFFYIVPHIISVFNIKQENVTFFNIT